MDQLAPELLARGSSREPAAAGEQIERELGSLGGALAVPQLMLGQLRDLDERSNRELVATAMAGYEGHRGWVNYLAVTPEHQGRGFGRAIMAEAEKRLEGMGCPKLNVQVRAANTAAVEFYRRLGYRIDDVVSLGKRTERDDEK